MLQRKVSTHSRDSAQFSYVFGVCLGRFSATPVHTNVAPKQQSHQRPIGPPPVAGQAGPRSPYVLGAEPELGTRRRDLRRAPTDREDECPGLGAQTGGGEGLSHEW